MEVWQKFKRVATVYRLALRRLKEAEYIEQALGYLPQHDVDRLVCAFATDALQHMDVSLTVRAGNPMPQRGILVGNHISYLDMVGLLSLAPVRFVSKVEVKYFPVMGAAATKAGTVYVKREKRMSRGNAGFAIANTVLNYDRKVAIFPAGTTTVDERKPWRRGAFRIAAMHDLWLQPFRIRYQPLRHVAYVDRDFFPVHLWNLVNGEKVRMEIEFADPVKVKDPLAEAQQWWRWAKEFLPAHQSETVNPGLTKESNAAL